MEEWVGSGKRVHSLRDHPNHDRPLNGGMWGGVNGAVPDMEALVRGWSNRDKYMGERDRPPPFLPSLSPPPARAAPPHRARIPVVQAI